MGLVAGAGLATAIWLPGRHDTAAAATQAIVFADDFNGLHGTPTSAGSWKVDGADSAAVHDGAGHLVLTQLLYGKQVFGQAYGHAEARVEVDRVSGPWRAFAVLDTAGVVMPGKLRVLDERADPTSGDAFHVYSVDWNPRTIVWSVDGRPSLELTPERPGAAKTLVLDLAADGVGPARMIVDYVRVTVSSIAAKPSATPSPAASPSAVVRAWKAFTQYAAGQLVTYKGVTYRVKEGHTSLPGWEPTALPNLFTKV